MIRLTSIQNIGYEKEQLRRLNLGLTEVIIIYLLIVFDREIKFIVIDFIDFYMIFETVVPGIQLLY